MFAMRIFIRFSFNKFANCKLQAGTVVHLRLVHDRETGKPKGYGFAEFSDVKSAELAIRNLNGYVVYVTIVHCYHE